MAHQSMIETHRAGTDRVAIGRPLPSVAIAVERAVRVAAIVGPGRLARWRNWQGKMPAGTDRVHQFHVRKTAGTSLYHAFLALGGEDPRTVLARIERRSPRVAYSGGYLMAQDPPRFNWHMPIFFSSSHKPAWSMNMAESVYGVTTLRDPVERVVSLYRYLADGRSDAGEVHAAPANQRRWAAGRFEEFVTAVPKSDLLAQIYMFSSSYSPDEAARRIRGCGCWFFTGSYPEGLRVLSRRLGIALSVRRDRPSLAAAPDIRIDDLAHLHAHLEPEYEMLRLLEADPGPGFVGEFPDAGDD